MPQILMPYTVQLDNALRVTPLSTLFARGDSNAHRFELKLMRAGVQDMLSGCKVLCKFYQISENTVVSVSGSVEDGKAIAVLTKACYEYIGRFVLTISIKSGDDETTVFYGDGYMQGQRADNAITGEYIVYDVDTLIGKISEIDAATDAADTATANANTAAENANAAAINAQAKADLADTAAQGASGWANATMTATGLPTGSAPTATVTTASDGHKVITLGIPRGNTGATPQISVEVQTGAAGSDASVSVSGTAENPVIHLTIPRGDTGAIENLTINGKTPDASGTVTLTAEDVGARPDTWMPTAEDVGARPDTWMPTAEDVGARPDTWMPTAEDVGALPTDGTAADSAKLGGKAPEYYIQPRNLLDNSDFTNPINQRGQTSYTETEGYSIDRWVVQKTTQTATLSADGITLANSNTEGYGYFYQKVSVEPTLIGTYTLAVNVDGVVYCSNYVINKTTITGTEITVDGGTVYLNYNKGDARYRVVFRSNYSGTISNIKWVAIYEGSYTADTLPPYVPKGYAQELAECQRYAYLIPPYMAFSGYITSSSKNFVFHVWCPPMRNAGVTPTVESIPRMTIRTVSGYSSIASQDSPGTPSSLIVQDYHPDSYQMNLCAIFSSDIGTNNTPAAAQFRLGDSALISLDL